MKLTLELVDFEHLELRIKEEKFTCLPEHEAIALVTRLLGVHENTWCEEGFSRKVLLVLCELGLVEKEFIFSDGHGPTRSIVEIYRIKC